MSEAASRFGHLHALRQPDGVHGASAIATPQRASSPRWRGVRIEARQTLTVLEFAAQTRSAAPPAGATLVLASGRVSERGEMRPYAAAIYRRAAAS